MATRIEQHQARVAELDERIEAARERLSKLEGERSELVSKAPKAREFPFTAEQVAEACCKLMSDTFNSKATVVFRVCQGLDPSGEYNVKLTEMANAVIRDRADLFHTQRGAYGGVKLRKVA